MIEFTKFFNHRWINIVGSAASVANRSFAGVGINTMQLFHIIKVIIKILHLIKFNISNDGKILTLTTTTNVVGVSTGTVTSTHLHLESKFPKYLILKILVYFQNYQEK